MRKIIIAHDFNLSIFLYRIPSDKFLKNYFNDKFIKFVDVNKLKKKDLNKITIFWGDRLNKKKLNELTNLKWVHFASSGTNLEIVKILRKRKVKISNSKGISLSLSILFWIVGSLNPLALKPWNFSNKVILGRKSLR